MNSPLFNEFTLKNGTVIKNRFIKAAMSEALANAQNQPSEKIFKLYEKWADGGAGVVISGHVMVDRSALAEPRNIVVDNEAVLPFLETWAKRGTKNNTHLWMQLNHPGKQTFKGIVDESVAPSAIPLEGDISRFVAPPRELRHEEILKIIQRFGYSAKLAQKAGFTGVQIHAAHGYLISQFLSPRHNQRKDEWGGDIKGRMKFLLEVYREIRNQTIGDFSIAVKMNSADFMKAGFTEEECIYVAEHLEKEGVDLLEISGGSYESPQMTGRNVKESTKKREAYFLDFAEKLRLSVNFPIMVTGGFRTKTGMEEAIHTNATDFIGLARPFAVCPELPNQMKQNKVQKVEITPKQTGIRAIDDSSLLESTWYAQQLERIGLGKHVRPNYSIWFSLFQAIIKNGKEVFQLRRAR
ncbi:NADH:flavin oxidoreductase/NADH oxidase family protein [Chengkuizengella axinellae]|uniref:NADH:flavin oxidoreductase/NADH oxidase family protein n=1 Tax=Chengkuizengella axinellae TaxID=3064388 RepID=A0ABT9J3T2_9BACL|nr:NADH:flavin oxidoreductase/NADH oxidase family protein [Chengkuizengella sp. 2205SS18-9]MDP5276259.1 NADH:flavin oxidoreductase/NADH oxidase family protein [Chengkuizengella sp. 2205SS18-9]